MIHLDLVDALDGDWIAAGILNRIQFRAGDGWWKATLEDLRRDMRLTEHQLRKRIQFLRELGFIESRRDHAYDAVMSWRVVVCCVETAAIPVNEESSISTLRKSQSQDGEILNLENEESSISSITKNSKELDKNSPDGEVNPIHLELCQLLETRIRENGSTTHAMNKSWLTAVRLMIDKDGRTVEDIRGCIEWCQRDEFWRANILSMGKLRKQFDQMRLRAEHNSGKSRQQKWLELYAETVDNGNQHSYPELEG